MKTEEFPYQDIRFADIQMLRYRLNGFEHLSLKQKELVYYLSQATLFGRDITFDQYGKYNLRIRKMLEVVYTDLDVPHDNDNFKALEEYLRRVWFSNGIYHHYGCEKFKPQFSKDYLKEILYKIDVKKLPLENHESLEDFCDEIFPVIFDEDVLPKRVNKAAGEDLIKTSACNFYHNISQKEAEQYYDQKKSNNVSPHPISYGLNSTLIKKDDQSIIEDTWKADGRYSNAIKHIVYWLKKAADVAENSQQKKVIELLQLYYITGSLETFNDYCIEWLKEHDATIDFINGFIEVYGDPLGLKGTWEGIVEYKDEIATERTQTISKNAQWFEDHSPVDEKFKKKKVKGVTANAICAAMLGGEEYPSTAIGINLPNADWIRAEHGSKSITITNITDAYRKAAHGNGFRDEFIVDQEIRKIVEQYGDICDELHTDLHECLGHGSGQLLPQTSPDALKNYGNTIEEARADLFGLYYIADQKLIELGLLPNDTAYKAQYYTYILNGLLTQLIRITPGNKIEEAHMRNRALIANWCYKNGNVISLEKKGDKTFVVIHDYDELRCLFGTLLKEVQRIKSEGDYDSARKLVEEYGVDIDPVLHAEILERYGKLDLAPYKGFINPVLLPVKDKDNRITDIQINYSESYDHQMLRYSSEYATLI